MRKLSEIRNRENEIKVEETVVFEIHQEGEVFQFNYHFNLKADPTKNNGDIMVDCEEELNLPTSWLTDETQKQF